jgi:hypothetical protein
VASCCECGENPSVFWRQEVSYDKVSNNRRQHVKFSCSNNAGNLLV